MLRRCRASSQSILRRIDDGIDNDGLVAAIAAGADVGAFNDEGRSIVHDLASREPRQGARSSYTPAAALRRVLLVESVDVNVRTRWDGDTPLHHAARLTQPRETITTLQPPPASAAADAAAVSSEASPSLPVSGRVSSGALANTGDAGGAVQRAFQPRPINDDATEAMWGAVVGDWDPISSASSGCSGCRRQCAR